MSRTFTIIDHTADIGIEFSGSTVEELFTAAAESIFSILTHLNTIDITIHRSLSVSADTYDDLLVNWLQELLYYFAVDYLLFADFYVKIDRLDNGTLSLEGICGGEPVDAGKHEIFTEIKTVTYHQLLVKQLATHWQGRIIVDI
ncbi:archease [candidate division KSB1 bacterium]